MTAKRILCIFLVLLFILPLGACQKTEEAYLYFECNDKPTVLDPQIAETTTELLLVGNLFEGLMRLDKTGTPVCGAAEKYECNGNTYTFTLREDAIWNNGDPLSADDFVFAFRRAVSPSTKAPFAQRLFCIKNAENIRNGKAKASSLGVTAKDDKTLVIECSKTDDRFLENLTTSVCMPCHVSFFEEAAGKYGLDRDHFLGNGSYRLAKWDKENFGIRLYKNENYTGSFFARNAAVFLTCSEDETPIQRLDKNSVDMAFIDGAKAKEMKHKGFRVSEFENICWVLTVGKNFPKAMRKSFIHLCGKEVYQDNLPYGSTVADSLFPAVLSEQPILDGMITPSDEKGVALFRDSLSYFEEERFPSDTVLYYYDDGFSKAVVNSLVGHWQNKCSAFINIEAVSSPEKLQSQLTDPNLSLAVFPVTAPNPSPMEYLKCYGITNSGLSLGAAQKQIVENATVYPLYHQNTCLCSSGAIKEIYPKCGNGYLDFSMIVKEE